MFEDGGDVAPDIIAGGERQEFLSSSIDDGFGFLEIDSCGVVGQRVVEEEASESITPGDGGLPVMRRV
jgi:hypothetical protein